MAKNRTKSTAPKKALPERIEYAFDRFLMVGGQIGGYRFRVAAPNSGMAPRFDHVTATTLEEGRAKIVKLSSATRHMKMAEVKAWFRATIAPVTEAQLKSRYAAAAGRSFSIKKSDNRTTLIEMAQAA